MKKNDKTVPGNPVHAPELEQAVKKLQARLLESAAQLEAANASHLVEMSVRSRTENSLRESEARYRTIFENSESATIIIDDDMTIFLVNAKFEKLTGYTRAEIEGKLTWTAAVLPEDRERMKEYHERRRESPAAAPSRYEFRISDKQGNAGISTRAWR